MDDESFAKALGVMIGAGFGCFLLNAVVFVAFWSVVSVIGMVIALAVMCYAMHERKKYVH